MAVFFYALILNIFFPLQKVSTKNYSSAKTEETGLKADFKEAVNENVSEDVAGLGFGYLLGEKSELPNGVEDKMKAVGLAQIIVVSGTHLSIIIGASRKVFAKISRFAALYFSIFLLIFYIRLIGVTPSITRASFVAILSILAWFFGREQRTFWTIILTLGCCLAYNPYYLTNVSFQISMLAYSGVVFRYRSVPACCIRYFYGRDKPRFFGSTILSSLSAIIACLPIQLYYFGTFNLISLLANLLILPTIPYAMGFTFLTGVFGMVHFDFLAAGLGKITEFILSYHLTTISELENRSEFMFEFAKNNPIWLVFYAIIVWLIIVAIHKNVKISESDAGNHDNSLVALDEGEDIIAKSVERNERGETPSAKRN